MGYIFRIKFFIKNHKYLVFVIGCFGVSYAQDNSAYYDQHAIGWHWYNEIQEQKERKEQAPDPVAQMNDIKKTVTYALDKAILNPTEENVRDYIKLQNAVSDRSSLFSQVWQKVLWKYPELNYALIHPVNSVGRQVDLELKHQAEDVAIKKLAQTSGLFFFYRSTCPYCQRFAPIVKSFANKHDLAIIPITTDGRALPEFPNSKNDRGQAERFQVTYEPALFAVNPSTHQAYPISYGLVSEQELRERILDLARDFRSE